MYRCVITAAPASSTTAAAPHESDTIAQVGKRIALGTSTGLSTISAGSSVGKGGGAVNTKLCPQLVHFAFLPMAAAGALRRLEQLGQATAIIVRAPAAIEASLQVS
ncbi:MAG TPA: hypothetical protein VFG04_20405 [Planctomycetaceae bacterium]|nr:hypothetical protein [Planctomycetaceae bacterium]